MIKTYAEELLALYSPEQQIALGKVRDALLTNPEALDTKHKESSTGRNSEPPGNHIMRAKPCQSKFTQISQKLIRLP